MHQFLVSLLVTVLASEGAYHLRCLGEAIPRSRFFLEFGYSIAFAAMVVLGFLAVYPDLDAVPYVLGPLVVGFVLALYGWVRR